MSFQRTARAKSAFAVRTRFETVAFAMPDPAIDFRQSSASPGAIEPSGLSAPKNSTRLLNVCG
ncbi:MAG TPA: hypothetical protein PKC43_02105 [Phycisphaerales bacterium]|nr:hypothetical protein [Phycisphaerales bacterium]HMP36219.1 hypothetical protein [Phycisphaerales bacterium]